jgi:hypothetical protein
MAPKKKPITVGKKPGNGDASYKPRTPGAASYNRPISTKPSQAGLVRSAQKTTSSGITKRPDGRAQSEGRSGRQSISKAKVTSEAQTRPSGSRGVYEKPNPKVTSGMGSRLAATNTAIKGAGSAALYTAANAALGPLVRKAGTALGNALKPVGRAIDDRLPGINSKDELKRKTAASKAANAKGPKAGPSPKATVTAFSKKTFDQAFKAARTAKAKTFTWRGNKYNTKLRGEK